MKTAKILLILTLAAGIFISACDDILSDLLKFDTEWYSIPFSVDPADTIGDLVFNSDEVEANLDSLLLENGLSADNMKSARVSDAEVSLVTSGYNFDPITRVELFIESPGLGSTRLAWLDTVPRGVTEIELDLNMDDLQDYLLENIFTLTAAGTLTEQVDTTIDFKANIRFLVRGGLPQ